MDTRPHLPIAPHTGPNYLLDDPKRHKAYAGSRPSLEVEVALYDAFAHNGSSPRSEGSERAMSELPVGLYERLLDEELSDLLVANPELRATLRAIDDLSLIHI